MSLQPDSEKLKQLDKLAEIYEHVRDITVKISNMAEDPLPHQLQQSVPGYLQTLCSQADMLQRKQWTFIVAGDSAKTKAELVSLLIDDSNLSAQLTPLCTQCSSQPISVHYSPNKFFHVVLEEGKGAASEPLVLENWEALHACVGGNGESQCGIAQGAAVEKVQMYLPSALLKEQVDLLLYPECVREQSEMPRHLLEELTGSHGLIYGLNLDNTASTEKLQQFVAALRRVRQSGRPPVLLMGTCMVVCFSNQQGNSLTQLTDQLPTLDESCMMLVPTHTIEDNLSRLHSDKLYSCMSRILNNNITNKIQYCFGWMQSFVSRVIHHLRAFLNQAEKSHEDRLKTHAEILDRLQALTIEAEEFLKVLSFEVDGKVEEAFILLRQHLLSEETLRQLCEWEEDEAPDEDLWQDLDNAIRLKIHNRISANLASWEGRYKFFDQLRPQIIEIYEDRFHGIKTEISLVETMIAKQDSRMCLSEISKNVSVDVGEAFVLSSLSYLPNNVNLKWKTKLLLGLAAPILLPIALTALLLGLPVIGGLAARDYLSDRLTENKIKEYNGNKVKYMQNRTREEVKKFCKSRDLEDYVKGELRPAYRCISQLQEDIPQQIRADRAQIESLRNDERDSKDLIRFYRPLVEIFEHSRLLLQVFRVLHIFREKTDIPFNEIELCPGSSVICEGLHGTTQPAYWMKLDRTGCANKRLVALKKITYRPEARFVEDYLQEEEAWRFQASPHIIRFLGVTKFSGDLYHVMEPIKCSLRQHISRSPVMEVSATDTEKFNFLKNLLMSVTKGLDYLHDRGWVHFDLSLDTIGMSLQNQPKLTNISCRKLFSVPRDVSVSAMLRYTHLPPEVLKNPPAAYTCVSEMYSVGVLMWEMWTGHHVYWTEINHSHAISGINDFVAYTERHRPSLSALERCGDGVTCDEARRGEGLVWSRLMQHCWSETDRITSKALLQLLEEAEGITHMPIKEQHFGPNNAAQISLKD